MTMEFIVASAALAFVASMLVGRKSPSFWLWTVVVGCALACTAAGVVLTGGGDWEWRSTFEVGGEVVHLRLDGLSAFFLMLVGAIGAVGAVYGTQYWSERENPASAPRGRVWWSALLLMFCCVLLSSNGLHFLIAWELFTVCAFFLITLDRQRREVRAAGWLYLAASHAGTVCLFAFFGLLAAKTGTWDLGPMREQTGLAPLFWLALCGFGVKAGVFPLHVWLPSAHANAPSHVSAILSGVAVKIGIYGILRFSGWLPIPPVAGPALIALGAVSAVLGIAFGLAQNDLKRLLAYCSVENVGLILMAIGGALLGAAQDNAAWGSLLMAGALLHVWNHGLFKSLLFFAAGSILHATGTREMSRLGGLWRTMPWTAGLFALGAVAISGLPPLNGFVGEWLVYLGFFDAVGSRAAHTWAAMPAVIALATAGALALVSFVKVCAIVFLGAPRTAVVAHAHECGRRMRASMLLLGASCVVMGLVPAMVWPLVARAADAWRGGAVLSTGGVPASLATLGPVHAVLGLVLLAAATYLVSRVRRNGLRAGLTWDCGYAAPTARMQYTAGSFAGIAASWFYGVLRPERKVRRPRGVFPGEGSVVERMPETVLEQVIGPVGDTVMRASTAVRQLQHGRLQSYILYLVGGLAAVVVIVVLGGRR